MDDDTTWAQFLETSPSTKTRDTRSHDPTQQTLLFWFLGLFSAVFLQVWWLSSLSFSFENSFALKGFWSWTHIANPKCQYFVLYVCQLNVITDPTALISIWYLIGRFASSIWRCCSNYFKTLVFSFISFFALGAKLQWKAVFKEVTVC